MDNPSLIHPVDFTDTGGTSAPVADAAVRLERVFHEQIASGLHPGAALVVLRNGRVLFDAAAGLANLRRRQPVTAATPFLIFSCTKSYTAICIHHLVEAGKVELDAPVAEYWSEFGCKGKEQVTIRHALAHQAGLPNSGMPWQIFSWGNPKRIARQLAGMQPEWQPGSRMEYHLVNGSFILAEVVLRVSGLPCDAYLQRHFLQPMGLQDTFTAMPVSRLSTAARIYNHDPLQRQVALVFNLPSIRRIFIPAASIHTTARDLALFFQMLCNGGTYAGRQYLKPETIRQAAAMMYDGPNGSSGRRIRWALGFTLGGYSEFPDRDIRIMGRGSTQHTFGHGGQGGASIAWADPGTQTVFAFVNNQLQDVLTAQLRFQALADCLWG